MDVVKKVRATVDKALDAAIDWIVTKAKALFAKLFSKKDKPDDRTEEQKDKDKLAAIADAEKLVTPTDFDEHEARQKLGPIKSKYRLLTLEMHVDSETETEETVHFSATASNGVTGGPKKGGKGVVGPLNIKRSELSWAKETLDHFLKDPIWDKYTGPAGEYQSAEIDIRHKVSISDAISSTDTAIKPKVVPEAAKLLAGKTVAGTNFAPTGKGRPGIRAAARDYLQAANNDISNLFLGDARVNRGIGKRFDTGFRGDKEKQKQEFVNRWGFKDEEFTITIERKSEKRGTVDETQTLTPKKASR